MPLLWVPPKASGEPELPCLLHRALPGPRPLQYRQAQQAQAGHTDTFLLRLSVGLLSPAPEPSREPVLVPGTHPVPPAAGAGLHPAVGGNSGGRGGPSPVTPPISSAAGGSQQPGTLWLSRIPSGLGTYPLCPRILGHVHVTAEARVPGPTAQLAHARRALAAWQRQRQLVCIGIVHPGFSTP